MSKPTPTEVTTIRDLWFNSDHSPQKIAKLVGVTERYIYSVVRSETGYHPPYRAGFRSRRSTGLQRRPFVPIRDTKISPDDARRIRDLWRQGTHTAIQLGEMFDVSQNTIYKIVKNRIKTLYDPRYTPPTQQDRRDNAASRRKRSRP
jgi:transposase